MITWSSCLHRALVQAPCELLNNSNLLKLWLAVGLYYRGVV